MGVRRGHDQVGVGRADPRQHGAGRGVARHHRARAGRKGGRRRRAVVEAQLRLLLAGTVAGEAMFGEQGADVPVEADRFVGGEHGRRAGGKDEAGQERGDREAGRRGNAHRRISGNVFRVADPPEGDRGPDGRRGLRGHAVGRSIGGDEGGGKGHDVPGLPRSHGPTDPPSVTRSRPPGKPVRVAGFGGRRAGPKRRRPVSGAARRAPRPPRRRSARGRTDRPAPTG